MTVINKENEFIIWLEMYLETNDLRLEKWQTDALIELMNSNGFVCIVPPRQYGMSLIQSIAKAWETSEQLKNGN